MTDKEKRRLAAEMAAPDGWFHPPKCGCEPCQRQREIQALWNDITNGIADTITMMPPSPRMS